MAAHARNVCIPPKTCFSETLFNSLYPIGFITAIIHILCVLRASAVRIIFVLFVSLWLNGLSTNPPSATSVAQEEALGEHEDHYHGHGYHQRACHQEGELGGDHLLQCL